MRLSYFVILNTLVFPFYAHAMEEADKEEAQTSAFVRGQKNLNEAAEKKLPVMNGR